MVGLTFFPFMDSPSLISSVLFVCQSFTCVVSCALGFSFPLGVILPDTPLLPAHTNVICITQRAGVVPRSPLSRILLDKSNELLRLLSLGGVPSASGTEPMVPDGGDKETQANPTVLTHDVSSSSEAQRQVVDHAVSSAEGDASTCTIRHA